MFWSDLKEDGAFNAYMDSLDARLRSAGVDIAARPLHAWSIISSELKVCFAMESPESQRINRWFTRRYGDKLKIDWAIGQMLVSVRGDPYLVRYPLVYGTPTVDLLALIDRATPALFQGLSRSEIEELGRMLVRGFEAFLRMSDLPRPLFADLVNARAQMMKRPPDPGMSKWSSQQALEKVLNAFVERFGWDKKKRRKRVPGHELLPLVELAEELGLPRLDRGLCSQVECNPDARYPGRVQVSPAGAIAANQAAVHLCGLVALSWRI